MKRYDIIKTDNYLLAVDKEVKPEENDWYWDSKQEQLRFGTNNCVAGGYKWKIIAHLPLNNAKPLEGVPLLPESDNNIEQKGKEYALLYADKPEMIYIDRKQGFIAGYKVAGGYTLEDMKNAFIHSGLLDIGKGRIEKQSFEEFIQSLKKYPIAFEAETEISHTGSGTYSTRLTDIVDAGLEPVKVLKIENNILQGKYIYK